MARTAKLALAVAIPLLIGGWALFRPELLFVHTKVSEAAPSAATSKVVSKGSFTSFAHETKGSAEILSVGNKTVLRLSEFTTSNGPDVHVYLVKGSDSNVVKDGTYIDLGTLKGTSGDQNYELPSGTNTAEYGSVAIWCKRFGVNFGGAELAAQMARTSFNTFPAGFAQLASYSGDIKVTSGKFQPGTGRATGAAEIIERNGARFLRLRGVTASQPVTVYLVKSESSAKAADVAKAEKVDLGTLKAGKDQYLPISKTLDIWLWRSVSLWTKDGKNLAFADLRSDQERSRPNLLS